MSVVHVHTTVPVLQLADPRRGRQLSACGAGCVGHGAQVHADCSFVITCQEATGALDVDPRMITVSIEDGAIPSVKIGRRIVTPREKFLPCSRMTRLPAD